MLIFGAAFIYFVMVEDKMDRAVELHAYVANMVPSSLANSIPNNLVSSSSVSPDSEFATNETIIEAQYINAFGTKFYPHFSPGTLFSPVSLAYVLTILRMGTDKPDKPKFIGHMPEDTLSHYHSAYHTSHNTNARMISMVCVNNVHPLQAQYNATVGRYLRLSSDNFSNKAEVNEKIKNLFMMYTNREVNPMAKGIRPESSVMVYDSFFFVAPWLEAFSETQSMYMDFMQSNGKRRNIRALHKILSQANYAEDERSQLLEIPFSPKRYVFGIFLPKSPESIPAESGLKPFNIKYDVDLNVLSNQVEMLRPTSNVNVTFPKLRQRRWLRLGATLKRMDYRAAFEPTGLSNAAQGATLTEVLHEVQFAVWERGANFYATGYGEESTSGSISSFLAPTITVHANRQFVYYVRDRTTKTFLLIGDFDA